MDKYRMLFAKTGRAVYISHLDLMRTITRAFLRAECRLKYSEGFNPHPNISIALPLSVGCESVCEIMDFKMLEDNKIPSVVIGDNSDVSNVHMVRIDSTDAAARVVEHFVNIGYKSIGMLCGRTPLTENRHKLEGFRQAIVDFGLDLKPEHIVYAPNTIEGGYIGVRKFFEMKERPEAILATSDTLAFGVIDAAADSGLSIPSDIALVGFDNIRMSNLVTPKLTTMEKPLHKMGVMGARLLFDFIEGEDDAFSSAKKEILLLPKLKIRKSCGHKERIGEMF